MTTFKIYTNDRKQTIFANGISELRDITNGTNDELKKAYYQGVTKINGFSIINLGR